MEDLGDPPAKIRNSQEAYQKIHASACEWLDGWLECVDDNERYHDMLELADFIRKVEGRIEKSDVYI